MPEQSFVPYKALKQKQKAHISDWMYKETLHFFLEHQRMPDADEAETLCSVVFLKVQSSNYRVAGDEIRRLFLKRLDAYAERVQRDADAGVTLDNITRQPKRKKSSKMPHPKKKRNYKNTEQEPWQDDRFFFIAGYTSGGAPYGVTWEEMGLEPWQDLSE